MILLFLRPALSPPPSVGRLFGAEPTLSSGGRGPSSSQGVHRRIRPALYTRSREKRRTSLSAPPESAPQADERRESPSRRGAGRPAPLRCVPPTARRPPAETGGYRAGGDHRIERPPRTRKEGPHPPSAGAEGPIVSPRQRRDVLSGTRAERSSHGSEEPHADRTALAAAKRHHFRSAGKGCESATKITRKNHAARRCQSGELPPADRPRPVSRAGRSTARRTTPLRASHGRSPARAGVP